ncbi:MAG: aminodeoxychorismate lyase [Candidatus Lightella neohaematopini]|nr:aminodeoxychorismate lyase [Candidatus Lightella neohaematopini]MCV2531331.1 aminodeoxychorismate lyase [Candidatus Lightella neohaematopini]
MYFINGVEYKCPIPNSRYLKLGDGFFTTIKYFNGRLLLLDWHIDRLIYTAKRLLFIKFNPDVVYQDILSFSKNKNNGIIKITISNIISNDFVVSINNRSLLYTLSFTKIPKYYSKWYLNGITLGISPIKLCHNSFLAGLKHTNRLEQLLIYSYIKSTNVDEVIVLDINKNIIECCNSNIFWRKGNIVYTPLLTYAGVSGIMRRLIIKLLPKFNYVLKEVFASLEEIVNSEEVFITNSLILIISVNKINNYYFHSKLLFKILSKYFKEINFI